MKVNLSHRFARLLLFVGAIGLCIWLIQATAAFGLSRLFGRYAVAMRSLDVAQAATQLAPNDATAHLSAATIASLAGSPTESLRELEKAIALRPSDYSLWLAVGLTRDQLGNTTGALAAFDEAVRHAPFYAHPRWQRGNLLLRTGKYEAAFADLNQAAQSNPELIPRLIDLAWSLSRRDPGLTEKLAQIQTPKVRIAFAKLLAREGKVAEAAAQLKAAGAIGDEIRRDLVQQLLAKGSYVEAYEIWRSPTSSSSVVEAVLYDGSFEGPLTLKETGFGWRVPGELKGVSLSLDTTDRHSGGKSLRIVFEGDSNPSSPVLSQLVLIEPSARYRVSFAARPKDIVSGGPPIAVILDASNQKRLGQSTPLNKDTGAWQIVSFEFTAAATTNAVILSVERESCTTSPCPIFGSLSLDSFSMERVK
jgi:carbohydrate binding protein with CBM4/9 domain/tetratricopeptide repeat protein